MWLALGQWYREVGKFRRIDARTVGWVLLQHMELDIVHCAREIQSKSKQALALQPMFIRMP